MLGKIFRNFIFYLFLVLLISNLFTIIYLIRLRNEISMLKIPVPFPSYDLDIQNKLYDIQFDLDNIKNVLHDIQFDLDDIQSKLNLIELDLLDLKFK